MKNAKCYFILNKGINTKFIYKARPAEEEGGKW